MVSLEKGRQMRINSIDKCGTLVGEMKLHEPDNTNQMRMDH